MKANLYINVQIDSERVEKARQKWLKNEITLDEYKAEINKAALIGKTKPAPKGTLTVANSK
jgi:hypothetical protein